MTKFLLALAILAFAQTSFSQTPPQLVSPADVSFTIVRPISEPHTSLRQSWDQTKRFCYKEDDENEIRCLELTDMQEIKLRDHGKWSERPEDQAIIQKLSDFSRTAAMEFDRLSVRRLALDGIRKYQYIAQISFIKKPSAPTVQPSLKTIFQIGRAQRSVDSKSTDVRVDSMSFNSAIQASTAILKAITERAKRESGYISDKEVASDIVKENIPLLNIGAEVVAAYLNSRIETSLNGAF